MYTCVARTASDRIEKSVELKVTGPPGMPASIWGEQVTAKNIVIRWVEGPRHGGVITSYIIEGYNMHEKYWKEVQYMRKVMKICKALLTRMFIVIILRIF